MSATEDEIVSRGLAAADLLAHPAFADTIKSLGIECFASFTETNPEEAAKREDAYNLYRGLQAIEHELNHRVQSMDSVVNRIDADNEAHDPEVDGDEGPIIIKGNTDQ